MTSSVFRGITPYGPLKVNRRFGEACRLHCQGRRISQARNQRESFALLATCFYAGLLFGLFFDPEDEGDMLLRNVGWFSTDYTALYPRRYNTLWIRKTIRKWPWPISCTIPVFSWMIWWEVRSKTYRQVGGLLLKCTSVLKMEALYCSKALVTVRHVMTLIS
jgi:hypothetical protein